MNQNGNDEGYYPSFNNSMNPNGQDGNNNSASHPPYNSRSQNSTFNGNLNYPFQMPQQQQQYFPQQSYMQQNYEDNFNPASLQHNQFNFNHRGSGGDDMVSSSCFIGCHFTSPALHYRISHITYRLADLSSASMNSANSNFKHAESTVLSTIRLTNHATARHAF